VAFYAEVGAATPPGLVPRCFDSHWDPQTGEWRLLLEDLTDTHRIATPWPLPPELPDAEEIIRARARFHAAWWDHPRLGAMWGHGRTRPAWTNGSRAWPRSTGFADQAGDGLSANRRALYARLFETAPKLAVRYHSHRHMTVIQGDSHVWNCFLPKQAGVGQAVLFDWDSWSVNVATIDLAYMMAVHWYPELRRGRESHLLDVYHAELLAQGVARLRPPRAAGGLPPLRALADHDADPAALLRHPAADLVEQPGARPHGRRGSRLPRPARLSMRRLAQHRQALALFRPRPKPLASSERRLA
jgi:hypothetical protein